VKRGDHEIAARFNGLLVLASAGTNTAKALTGKPAEARNCLLAERREFNLLASDAVGQLIGVARAKLGKS
jgi:hypothetical protein